MSTLNDAIKAEITKLEGDIVNLKAQAAVELAAKIATVEADISTAKAHLSGLGPWLSNEVSVVKNALVSFFDKIEHKTPAPVAPAPAPAPVAPAQASVPPKPAA